MTLGANDSVGMASGRLCIGSPSCLPKLGPADHAAWSALLAALLREARPEQRPFGDCLRRTLLEATQPEPTGHRPLDSGRGPERAAALLTEVTSSLGAAWLRLKVAPEKRVGELLLPAEFASVFGVLRELHGGDALAFAQTRSNAVAQLANDALALLSAGEAPSVAENAAPKFSCSR